MNFKKLKNTLYALPFALLSILPTHTNGQDWSKEMFSPLKNIQFFNSNDTTANAKAYDKLTTKEQRDSIAGVRQKEDWTNTIRGTFPPLTPYIWDCNDWTLQLIVNSHDYGKEIYYANKPLFNKYSGREPDSIQKNQGSIIDMGKLGLPMYELELTDPVTLPQGHAMNAILIGDDALNFDDWLILEPSNGKKNIKPGDGQSPFPKNCNHVQIYYDYIYKSSDGKKNFYRWPVLKFESVEGKVKLIYNVNEDTNYLYGVFPAPIQYKNLIHIITNRAELDTLIQTAPKIISPIANQTGVEYKDIQYKWDPVKNAKKYTLEIALDSEFKQIIKNLTVTKTDTITTLPGNRTIYSRIKGVRTTTSGPWSQVQIETRNDAPNQIEIINPKTYNLAYDKNNNIIIETNNPQDLNSDKVTKTVRIIGQGLDTLITTLSIPLQDTKIFLNEKRLQPESEYNITATATDGKLSTTAEQKFKTPKMVFMPGQITITNPINNTIDIAYDALKVSWNTESNSTGYELQITNEKITNTYKVIRTDTTLTNLYGNRLHTIKVRGINRNYNGPWSQVQIETRNDAPTTFQIQPINGLVDISRPLEIITTNPTDKNNDAITKKFKIEGIDGIVTVSGNEKAYLPTSNLKPNTLYTLTGEVTDGKLTTAASNKILFQTGILSKDDVTVFPNPVKDYININAKINTPTTVDIKIYDLNGRLVNNYQEKAQQSFTNKLDVKALRAGIYIVDVTINNQSYKTKISKQ